MELGALAILGKLTRQDCLDMLRLASEEKARPSGDIYLHEIGAFRGSIAINIVEQFKDSVVYLRLPNCPEPGNGCGHGSAYKQFREAERFINTTTHL
jgi:hypothetical protein